jgi:hypothetical protein
MRNYYGRLLSTSQWVSLVALVAWNAGCGDDPTGMLPTGVAGTTVIATGGTGSVSNPHTPTAMQGGAGVMAMIPVTAGPSGVAGSGPDVPPATTAQMPCEVSSIVAQRCASCHGAAPIGGAPMPLVTQADWSAKIKSLKTVPGQTMEVAQLAAMRINDSAKPMPPTALLADNERSVLNAWLERGHPQKAEGTPACAQPMQQPMGKPEPTKNPDGTVCYQFRNHGSPEPGDMSPYPVVPGEHYVSFYYTTPWKEPAELVSWRTVYDNQKVMHHWLLYSTLGSTMDGTFAPSIGTHIGDAAELVAGWAVGGNDVHMPKDVGLQLPPPGAGLLLEWHFYNPGEPTMDSSAVEICTLPAGTMKNTAGMTWLGTENFNGIAGMPPKTMSTFSGTCLPSREGMNDTDPIRIFTLWPHMHTYGRNMKTVVNRANGTQEEVFNKPFNFDYQITYDAAIDLYPGDTITSTCTFMNTSDLSVAFGPSTDQEMCYQFAFSYPVRALSNGVPSLVGATNTCWDF